MKIRPTSVLAAAEVLPLMLLLGAILLGAVSVVPTHAQDGAAASAPGGTAGGTAGNVTWYVDAAAGSSGDGTRAATAVQTIPEGLALAARGDTVLVAAGVYTAPQPIPVPPGVRLLGASAEEVIVEGPIVGGAMVELSADSVLEGFHLRSSSAEPSLRGVRVLDGGASVLHNRIEDARYAISIGCGIGAVHCAAPVTVTANIIGGTQQGIGVMGEITTTVRNNTVQSRDHALTLYGQGALVENNLFISQWGAVCSTDSNTGDPTTDLLFRHNNFQGGDSLGVCPAGEGNTSYNALLRDAPQGDFRLTAGSPLRGRGTDGGDIGALPFVPVGSPPAAVTTTALSGNAVKVEWSGGAGAYDVFVGDSASSGAVYTRRESVSAVSVVVTRENPLLSPLVAVSSVDAGGDSSELVQSGAISPLVLRNATVEQDSPLLWVDNAWQTVQSAAASGGAYLANSGPSSRIQIVFEGDTLVLGRRLGPQGGSAQLTVDGAPAGYLNFQFFEDRWRLPATLSGFGPGIHLLEIRSIRSSGSGTINLDFLTAPSTAAPSAAQLQAVGRVNFYRTTAGLAPVRGDLAIHMAAQAHADYYARNRKDPRLAGLGFHAEHADLPGFTGTWPGNRTEYFGYPGRVGEDGHFLGDPIDSIDGWMATVYHRNLIMCYGCTDMGYGVVAQPDNKVDALNLGSVTPKRPGARLIYTYPAVNQANVPREWNGAEVPDPLPGAPRPVGYPISLYIAQPSMPGSQAADPASGPAADPLAAAATAPQPLIRDAATVQASAPAWSVTAADLYTASGVQVPVVMLDQDTDVPKYLGADVVFLIPRQPLAADTTYVAHIAGTDSRGIPFDYRWAFSTGREVAAPDFTPTRMWADRPFPAAGDTVTVHVQLANNGPRAEQVAVRAALPAQASYVRGSAATSQGTVTGEGPLQFSVGVIEKGGRVELQFSLAVPVDAALPLALEPEIELTWSLGQLTRRIPVLAGGAPLYLPLTAR